MPILEAIEARVLWETGKGILHALPNAIKRRRFASFFGPSAISGNKAFAVLDPYSHPLPRIGNRYVKKFLGRRRDQPLIGEDNVLGVNVVRNIARVSALFSQFRSDGGSIPFVTDGDVADRWDGTFLCFGSSDSNIKTLDIELLPQQTFYRWEFGQNGQRCIRGRWQRFRDPGAEGLRRLASAPQSPSPRALAFRLCGTGRVGNKRLHVLPDRQMDSTSQATSKVELHEGDRS
jgi:hypothetical protein